MDITVCTMTHARTKLLSESLDSALRLHLPEGARLRVLVVNDCPEQTLVCRDPRVEVTNHPRVIPTLGEKRNLVLSLVKTEWIAWLDDDDIVLPNHLERLSSADGLPCVMPTHGFWFNGSQGELKGAAANDLLVQTQFLRDIGGYAPDPSIREEWTMMDRLKASGKVRVAGSPTYVERWGNGAYHVSGLGADPSAHTRFRQHALRLLALGVEPKGRVEIIPGPPAFNFNAACAELLKHAP